MQTQTEINKIIFNPKDIADACAYIEEMWGVLKKSNREDNGTLIGLPFDYILPSAESSENFVFEEMYYWDSYFIAKGLLATGHDELAEGMLENLLYLYKRFHIIPNGSRFYMTGRSQPPILTSFIFDIYEKMDKSEDWLKKRMHITEQEYENVWTASSHPNIRNVYRGLSRYYDINYLHDLSEAESGWDMTTRFNGKCLDYIPIDLNCLLYKYESDFARAYAIFGDSERSEIWRQRASIRATTVTLELWNSQKGFFFDLNYQTGEQSEVWSLATFYSLWSGLASKIQAEKIVDNLNVLLAAGGLCATDKTNDPREFSKQWAHPNGWAPLQYFAIKGLENYGYHNEASSISRLWLKTNLDYYKIFGVFREAYNVVEPLEPPVEGVYPSQIGFGWTNGVFVNFCQNYLNPEEKSLI